MAELFIMNGIQYISLLLKASLQSYILEIYLSTTIFLAIGVTITIIYAVYVWRTYSCLVKRRELCRSLFNLIPEESFLLYNLKKFMQDKKIMNRLLKL